MLPNKKDFKQQVDSLNLNENVQKLLFDLYEDAEKNKQNDTVDEIINCLFPKTFTKDNMIPYSFVFTPIGTVLFTTLFNNTNYCSMNDVIEYSFKYYKKGLSRQYLSQEIYQGRLKALKYNGRWKFRKSDVKKYFENK